MTPIVPPYYLLEDCPHPKMPKEMRSGGLKDYSIGATLLLLEYEHAIDACNADKAALRHWYENVAHGSPEAPHE